MSGSYPAFPSVEEHGKNCSSTNVGLTKREFFAAMAMQSLIITRAMKSTAELVQGACLVADALLAELEKKS